ncbi:MAG: hypothetical protein HWD59_10380 [Coxiellaceae bacterium]|nr:MAG: hypothetical protein HWD59_10380 [Coxiellaceae bacterium]
MKNNSNSKSITVEKLWGAIFVISGIVEELNKAFSVLQDSSQIMDDLKTLSQNIDSMASEDFNDQAYQDLIETSLQNVAKLAQAIQKHQNYQIISSHQAPSLSSKNMMPIIPDEYMLRLSRTFWTNAEQLENYCAI